MYHHGYLPVNGLPRPPPLSGSQHEQHQYTTPIIHPPPQPLSMYAQQSGYTPSSGRFNVETPKQTRARQACEECRKRKQKCNEGSPCSFCKEGSISCEYRDAPPAKADKHMAKLLDYMEVHSNRLQALSDRLQALSNTFETLDSRLQRVERLGESAVAGAVGHPTDQATSSMRTPGLGDHRTAPHKLLQLWTSVDRLLKHSDVIEYRSTYVMAAENRGFIRLHTRGEGIDECDGTQPGSPLLPNRSDHPGSDGYAPTSPEGLWGTGLLQTPNSDSQCSEPSTLGWGGLKADNSLDLDISTINSLHDSYITHIHVMHPFIDEVQLRQLVKNFKFVVPNGSESERPSKRQRSNGRTTFEASDGMGFRSQQTERSPENAIFYLVLALGKISQHQEPLPPIVANNLASHSRLASSSSLSTTSKRSHISLTSTQSATDSISVLSQSRSRNLDVIPGLAYYTKATEILGEQGDGNELAHAQMFLLAGLYQGQLARVKDSMSWYSMAGRAVQTLLQRHKLFNEGYWTGDEDVAQKMKRGQSLINNEQQNMIILAAWTCLQLESDILTELPLPSSGITSMDNSLLMPNNELEHTNRREDFYNIMLYYLAQLFLQKTLNQVHREVYGQDCLSQSLESARETLMGHGMLLDMWRQTLPPTLQWDDADPPATDILAARLRAKYWEAVYITNLVFLDYAHHIMPFLEKGRSVKDAAIDADGEPRVQAEIHLFEAIKGMDKKEIWLACKHCVNAAMQGTIALDGMPGRLVVTNIHGTAHAQFGNMLVLLATSFSSNTHFLVSRDRLQALLVRTISFLQRLSPISPTLNNDCIILEKIQRVLF